MKKVIVLFAMLLCMSTAASAGTFGSRASYVEKNTTVITDSKEVGELPLRFYTKTPHIPYLGIGAYSEFVYKQPLTLRQNEDGTCALVNPIGEEVHCDPKAGTIEVRDWNRFFDLPLPLENEAKGWKDTATRFVRILDVAFEGEPEIVLLDFARYGITVYADEKDIYLPVSTLSNMMTDIATNYMLYNGEKLFVQRVSLSGEDPAGVYESEVLRAETQGRKRPADIRKQAYADLCFTIDYFFGHPGIAFLDQAVADQGLDKALTNLGKDGEALKAGLTSEDLSEYVSSLYTLFFRYLSDGHTLYPGSVEVNGELFDNQGMLGSIAESYHRIMDFANSPATMRQLLNSVIPMERKLFWGDEVYRECDNTAIIRLDSFMPDEEAWDLYYKGEGDFPEDCLGIVLTGLKRASENPEIENVILDLSCNSGGSPDVMMAILAVTTGQDQLFGIHKLTNRRMTFTFEADTNFDGVYDEKDKETKYDFNYGVLVTRYAFSCGNLFPIIFREGGAVLIGEPSGGGSCCIQIGTDPEGFYYFLSSAQWQLTDSENVSVEGGCKIDLPIEAKTNGIGKAIYGLLGMEGGVPSYENYFDEEHLSELMNDYFMTETEADVAA